MSYSGSVAEDDDCDEDTASAQVQPQSRLADSTSADFAGSAEPAGSGFWRSNAAFGEELDPEDNTASLDQQFSFETATQVQAQPVSGAAIQPSQLSDGPATWEEVDEEELAADAQHIAKAACTSFASAQPAAQAPSPGSPQQQQPATFLESDAPTYVFDDPLGLGVVDKRTWTLVSFQGKAAAVRAQCCSQCTGSTSKIVQVAPRCARVV